MDQRSTREVFEQHLRFRVEGKIDQDLEQDYADDVVLICGFGALHGRQAVRESAKRLGLQLPGARFEFSSKVVDGEYAFLVWKARTDGAQQVHNGVDSFVIRNGRIVMQSIHYQLEDRREDQG